MLQVRKEGPGQGPGHTETRNRDMEGCGRVPKMRRVEGGQMKTKRKADRIYDTCPQCHHPISFFNPLYQQLAEKDEEILHQKQMIICLRSGCVGVPTPAFAGPNQDCIPCERLIKKGAGKEMTDNAAQ